MPRHPSTPCTLLVCAIACLAAAAPPVEAAVDADGAARVFADAKAVCERDHGALWGRSLCGPMLLVDPADHALIANEADRNGVLKADGQLFKGTLPDEVIVADTPTEWSGTRWTQLIWPVTFEPMIRPVTLAHEMFHRIQPGLGLSRPEAGNRHLDTLEGRYLMQLEWRALTRALMAVDAGDRRARVADALAFRAERQRRFANATADEGALEINEGIPEYTGVRLGLGTAQERTAFAIFDLSRYVVAPTFVRSFAYASGPAYGLLLDEADPAWRGKLATGKRLDELLASAMSLTAASTGDSDARKRRYDDGALLASETRRDQERVARMKVFTAALVDGAVLVLPIKHSNYRFNPQTLVPLEGVGTIYPTMRLTDDWGDLLVERGGALVRADHSLATVSLAGASGDHLKGDGWTLKLKPGWRVVPGVRAGDWKVVRDAGA